MERSKKITDGALLTAVYVVLMLLVVFIPFIQIFGIFLLPIPFIMYGAKYGFRASIIMALAAFALSLAFATALALPLALLSVLGGMAIGSGIYRKRSAYEIWAQGTVGFIIGFVAVIALLQFVFSINIFEQMDAAIQDSIELTKSLSQSLQVAQEMNEPIELIEEQLMQVKDYIPSTIAVASMIMAFIAQWLSYRVINRIDQRKLAFPPFKHLNFPVAVIWIYFIAILFSLFNLESDSTLYIVMLNVMTLLTVLLLIQGYSFVFFFADYQKWHVSIPIVILLVSLFVPLVNVFLMFIIRIIGIIDLGFSMKQKISQQKP